MSDFIDIINNKSAYIADNMGEYTIDGFVYKNYTSYTFVWEKSYVKSPERSQDGSIGNLETYSTFVTPHLTVNYSLMTIDDYRSIMKQYLEKNEFTVSCYDPINDNITTNKMYFATPSTPKFVCSAMGDGTVALLGVENYTIELIGTNNKN